MRSEAMRTSTDRTWTWLTRRVERQNVLAAACWRLRYRNSCQCSGDNGCIETSAIQLAFKVLHSSTWMLPPLWPDCEEISENFVSNISPKEGARRVAGPERSFPCIRCTIDNWKVCVCLWFLNYLIKLLYINEHGTEETIKALLSGLGGVRRKWKTTSHTECIYLESDSSIIQRPSESHSIPKQHDKGDIDVHTLGSRRFRVCFFSSLLFTQICFEASSNWSLKVYVKWNP